MTGTGSASATTPSPPPAVEHDGRSENEKLLSSIHEHLKGLAIGRIVIYTDATKVKRPALVTKIYSSGSPGAINLVCFAVHKGDQVSDFEENVRYSPGGGPVSWCWPEKV